MKRLHFSAIGFLLIVALCFGLLSCTDVSFKVDFIVDGEIYDTADTSGNESVILPKDPEKEGYTFVGWFFDEGIFEKPFFANSFIDAPLSSDISVYAKWEHTAHTPGEWILVKSATRDEEGLEQRICTLCGATVESRAIEKKPVHVHAFENRCDRYCEICGMERVTYHVYDNDCDPTCNECGRAREAEHQFDADDVCNVCGYVKTSE
jgi:uncharacterized repeat protein (TIGR02543 family)